MEEVKSHFHPRSKHRGLYNFPLLIDNCPELNPFVFRNAYNKESIDFSNTESVKMLNKALLKSYYNIEEWDIPKDYLIPPIPGRADYIHYLSDILAESNSGIIPNGKAINCLDIGVGANCIYPIIGCNEYGWSFVGSDIDSKAIQSAKKIVSANSYLNDKITIRSQKIPDSIFTGVIQANERFDLSMCNPPFHSSKKEAEAGTLRKIKNLNKKKKSKLSLNFGGVSNELWCEGGEELFIKKMINESKDFAKSVFWFTTLVSKESNLLKVIGMLNSKNVEEYKVIEMNTGNKKTRFLAWSFLSKRDRFNWVKKRWK